MGASLRGHPALIAEPRGKRSRIFLGLSCRDSKPANVLWRAAERLPNVVSGVTPEHFAKTIFFGLRQAVVARAEMLQGDGFILRRYVGEIFADLAAVSSVLLLFSCERAMGSGLVDRAS